MKIAAVIFFCSAGFNLFAQPTNGVVSGHLSGDGKALHGASVVLLEAHQSTYTDSAGNFSFKSVAAGKYTLRASYTGFEKFETKIEVESSKTTRLDSTLRSLTVSLSEVQVNESLLNPVKTKSIEKIDVLSAKEFVRNPVSNVFDALVYAKGIFCDIDKGMSNPIDININGLEGNFDLFTIDGVPAMNNLAGIFALSAFPLSMVDNIQIEKGSNSAAYGSDAMAGIISIITKEPSTIPRLTLNTMFDSKLESEQGLTAAFHLKKTHTLFSVASDNMNSRWDINDDNFMDIPLVNRTSFYNKWSFIRKENRPAIIYARYLFEDRFIGQMDAPGRLKGSDQYYTQWLGTNQWQAGFQYQLPVSEKLVLLADYSEHYQEAWFDTVGYNGALRNVFSQLSWNKKIRRHELTSGIAYRLRYYQDNTGLSDAAITGIGNDVHTAGAFVLDEISIQANKKMSWGIRFDYSNLNGAIAAPHLGYKWNSTNQGNIIRLVAGTGYRVPNVLNEGFTALETSRRVIVPEKLKTEYSVSLNLDYTHMRTFNSGVMRFEAGLFGVYLVNFVEPDYHADSSAVIYKNSKGGGSLGFNTSLDWAFNFPLQLGFNCTYAYTFEVDKADGEIELETPTHAPYLIGNIYASYTLPKQQVTFDLTGNIISPMQLATVPNDYRTTQSPWFSLLNIQITKKFKKGIELFGGIKNVFNFVQDDPILRPDDPFNRDVNTNNPNNYHFDTAYAYYTIEGIKGFVGMRYTLPATGKASISE